MCLIDCQGDGVMVETLQKRMEMGIHPRMESMRFQIRSLLLRLTQECPDLAFSICLSWVDLEARWAVRTNSSADGGRDCLST